MTAAPLDPFARRSADAKPAPPPWVNVSAGLIVRQGRLLACQRRGDQSHPHRWEFPGGKVEPGETFEACLRRELCEELSIEVERACELWRTEHVYPPDRGVRLVFFAVRAYRGTIANRIFAALRWVPVAELASLDFLEADRGLIAQLTRGALSLDGS